MAIQPTRTASHNYSLAFEHRNDVLCTADGTYHDPKDMVVWYVNDKPTPFGPGKGRSEVHYICNSEKCKTKIAQQRKVN
jgi:hypothetical protein